MSNIIYHLPSLANIYAKINWSGGVKESNLWIFKISVGNKYSVGVEKQRSEKSALGKVRKVHALRIIRLSLIIGFQHYPC